MSGEFLLIYICNFHVLSNLLLIYIWKLHWNLNTIFVCQVNYFWFTYEISMSQVIYYWFTYVNSTGFPPQGRSPLYVRKGIKTVNKKRFSFHVYFSLIFIFCIHLEIFECIIIGTYPRDKGPSSLPKKTPSPADNRQVNSFWFTYVISMS